MQESDYLNLPKRQGNDLDLPVMGKLYSFAGSYGSI